MPARTVECPPNPALAAEKQSTFRSALDKHPPLVSLDDVKAHLLLITAFKGLIEGIKAQAGKESSASMDAFLSRALYRLELWVTAVLGPSTDRKSIDHEEVPPLDVALVLHAYMLSPHRFFEDATTRFPQLWAFRPFPLARMAELIDPVTFEYKPSIQQRTYWEECTNVAFNPTSFRLENQEAVIACPFCDDPIEVLWESGGSGLGEANFISTCDRCGYTVTHDQLRVAKFLKCLQAITTSEKASLPGTLVNVRGDIDLPHARIIAFEVIKALQNVNTSLPPVQGITMAEIAKQLHSATNTKLRSNRIDALLCPYKKATPFSHDIARSVILQETDLNDDLLECGWCSQEYRSGPCSELEEAYSHYCTFLELATHPEYGAVVPTAAIDLLWHTHQLAGSRYKDDMEDLLGIYLDHISREEDMSLWVAARDNTQRQWTKIREEDVAAMGSANAWPGLDSTNRSGGTVPGALAMPKACTSMTQDFIHD